MKYEITKMLPILEITETLSGSLFQWYFVGVCVCVHLVLSLGSGWEICHIYHITHDLMNATDLFQIYIVCPGLYIRGS